jgi:hypothetical protein
MVTVSSYRVILHHKTVTYASFGSCWTMAQLRLNFTDGQGVWLIFYDPEKTATVPTADTASANAMIFIPKDQYPWHIDLLRNEHPIYYVNDGGSFWQGSLRTGEEEVGEGE